MQSDWTLESVAREVGGRLSVGASPQTAITSFHLRPVSCGPGSIFLPIYKAPVGMYRRALARGAAAVLTDSLLPDEVPHIWVPDLQDTALRLATARRADFTGRIVGITGSAGKSTTKTMLAHVLQATNSVFATQSNQNLTPYVKASLCSLRPELDIAVFEMALLDPQMVEHSAALARPHIGIITSIGMNHAEFHDDPVTGILNSKTMLFWGLEPGSTAILPTVDPSFARLKARAEASGRVSRLLTCGYETEDDVHATALAEHATYSDVEASVFGEIIRYRVPVPGIHMVSNSLLVAAALKVLDQPVDTMDLLETYTAPRSGIRRFEVTFPDKRIELVDDAIISSPHQVKALLGNIARRSTAKRRVLVFGDMTALGPDSIELHKELAPEIEEAGIDLFIAVGPHSAHLAEKLSIPVVTYPDADAAAAEVDTHFTDGDLVILKASGPTNFKRILKSIYRRSKRKRAAIDWTIEAQDDA